MAKLYFYYSAMNAGKTTTLLQSAHNYRERGMRVAILAPRLDDRAAASAVVQPRTADCTACWSTRPSSWESRRSGS